MEMKTFIEKHSHQCDFVAIRLVYETLNNYQYRNGKPLIPSSVSSKGAMIEVHCCGHIAYAGTNVLTHEGLEAAFESALVTVKSLKNFARTSFNSQLIRPPAHGIYNSPKSGIDSASLASINSFLRKSNNYLKNNNDHIVNCMSGFLHAKSKQQYYSSLGSEIEQNFEKLGLQFSATAQKGSVVQNRSLNGSLAKCRQSNLGLLDEETLLEECKKISLEVVELLDAEECPTERLDLVLMPDQMMLQIHESIGHPLEVDRILGDERNFAGSSFVKLKDIGTLQYGSKHMNITFDPTVEGELASYAFDDNGNPATKEHLIKNGKLVRALGGLESQFRSQKDGVANSRATSWNRAPIDRMANLNLEAGESSFDEIIASVTKGVLMFANKSWSIDDFRDKFQFSCEYAKLIENGKITKTLRNPNYRGQTLPFWHNLKMVGNEKTLGTFGTFYCGKGEPSQIISVGHRSPICLFSNIEVFGGH
jgi:predicted Zn-dependent protease